jgi:hypothetical protein
MMEVVSYDTGRVTWLFPTEEFVPLGGADGILIIQKIAERYRFKNFPDNPNREEVDKNGLKFSVGMFESEANAGTIGEFILYNDGIVAVSNTTERSAAFLDDIVDFVIREFKFRRPISPIKKISVSIMTVEFEKSVADMLANQAALTSLIGSYLNAPQGTSHDVVVTRIEFSLDDPAAGSNVNARPKLILESRALVPLARHRYYSNAALQTLDHVDLLSKIEKMFMNFSTTDV